jgi:hypothetical protein
MKDQELLLQYAPYLDELMKNSKFKKRRQADRKARRPFSEKSLTAGRENWMAYKEKLVRGVSDGASWNYDQETWLECITRTEELVLDRYYWISKEWEKTGAFVKILEKSTDLNDVGLPSKVKVEVVRSVGAYTLGMIKTMNATQIYDHRAHSSIENFRKKMSGQPYLTPAS